jgi:hypothetical protein
MNAKEARAIDRFIAAADKRIAADKSSATIKLYDALKVDLIEMLSNRRAENRNRAARAVAALHKATKPPLICGLNFGCPEPEVCRKIGDGLGCAVPLVVGGEEVKAAASRGISPLIIGPDPTMREANLQAAQQAIREGRFSITTRKGARRCVAVDSWLFDNGGGGA